MDDFDEKEQAVAPAGDEKKYDAVIRINSLESLVSTGVWVVDVKNPRPFQSTDAAVYTSVHGRENRGKTFLFRLLSGHNFENMGLAKRTESISLSYIPSNKADTTHNKCAPLLLLDTAGTNAPYAFKNRMDRLATDCFVHEVVYKVSHINIVMVNFLDLDDQRYFDELALKRTHERIKGGKAVSGKVVIVHNFAGLTTVEQVENQIKRDVLVAFDAKPQLDGSWFKSAHFSHYILAQEGSDAGQHYNQRTINLLCARTQSIEAEEVSKVYGKIKDVINQLLPVYLMVEEKDAERHSSEITIDGLIQEKPGGGFQCNFTNRELRMSDNVQLEFEPACFEGQETGYKLTTEKPVKLSTFLQPTRISATFLENSVFEPKIDLQTSDDNVQVTLDVPGCVVTSTISGTELKLAGRRQLKNGDSMLAERPSGKFTIRLTFPTSWDLTLFQESSVDGVYSLSLPRNRRELTQRPPRVVGRVSVADGGVCLEVEQSLQMDATSLKCPPGFTLERRKADYFAVVPKSASSLYNLYILAVFVLIMGVLLAYTGRHFGEPKKLR